MRAPRRWRLRMLCRRRARALAVRRTSRARSGVALPRAAHRIGGAVMNSGPPTQSEIDYGCAVELVRRERKPRAQVFLRFVFVALVVWGVAFAIGYARGWAQ